MILVDAGPLVAIVDASDQHHRRCVSAFKELREPLATVWPALTEAMYLLLDLPAGQEAVWEMVERRAVRILSVDADDVPRIRELMARYGDRPMDLADAAIVRVAEREGLDRIFTVDVADFSVYRLHARARFRLIPRPSSGPAASSAPDRARARAASSRARARRARSGHRRG